MGMFDYIRCDYPIPVSKEMLEWDLDMQNMEYQTKDLDNFMEEYFINPEGELYYTHHEREWVDDDDAFLKGYFKIVKSEVRPANYHGTMEFYCYEDLGPKDGKHYSISADYEAKFTDNKLVHIELIEQRIEDTTEYVLMCEEKDREYEIKKSKWYNKYFFYTTPYRKFARSIIKMSSKLSNLTSKLNSFLIRHL
jgi:hypothetical protein